MDELVCGDVASTHDGRDVALFWTGHGPNRRRVALCRGCHAGLIAIGMEWRAEMRADPERPDRGVVHGPLNRRIAARATA